MTYLSTPPPRSGTHATGDSECWLRSERYRASLSRAVPAGRVGWTAAGSVVQDSARFFEVGLPLLAPTLTSPLSARDKHGPVILEAVPPRLADFPLRQQRVLMLGPLTKFSGSCHSPSHGHYLPLSLRDPATPKPGLIQQQDRLGDKGLFFFFF